MTVNLKIQKAFKGTKTTVDRKTDKGNEAAAKLLEFEHAAYLRDKIKKLRGEK